MRKFRIISVFLILLLLLQCIPFASAEGFSGSAEAAAVADYLLSEDFFSDEAVTRAEFTGALVRSFCLGEGAGFEQVFDDVDEATPYAAEITFAYKAGIISPAHSFEPTAPIQYEQAVKMIVSAIGYGNIGEYYGGYPAGYIKAAMNIKLLKNIEAEEGGMTQGMVKELLYNLLTSTVRSTGIVNDTVRYERTDTDYMESVHGLRSAEGIVTGTRYNSYRTGTAIMDKGTLEVEGVSYKCDTTTPDMLGMNVCVYYDDMGSAEIIIPVDNEEIIIEGDDVEAMTKTSLRYYKENGRAETENISGAVVVYNGRVVSGFDLDSLSGDSASFRLLNNDGDSAYEYVFVYDYQYLYVDYVDTRNNSVSDHNGSVYLFDAEPYDTAALIYSADGDELELADIKSGDLLTLAMSDDNAFAILRKCGTMVTGTITDVSDEDVVIDGNVYELSGYANANYPSKLIPGSSGVFIIGRANDIVVANASADVMQYGYLIDAIINDGMDSEVMIKLYTASGEIKIYSADRVYFDGDKTPAEDDDILTPISVNGKVTPQLIRYKTDAEGEYIVNIDLAETDFDFEAETVTDKDTLRRFTFTDSAGAAVTSFNYRSGGKSCAPYFNVDGTVIFSVPDDSEIKSAEAAAFTVAGSESLSSNRNYTFDVYDLSDQGTAGAIVLKGEEIFARQNYIVESALRGLLPDGDEGYVLHVYGNRAYTTYYLRNEDAALLGKTLSGGDIIELSAGSQNIISSIALVFDGSGDVPVPNTKAGSDIRFENPTNISYYYGALYSKGTTYGYLSKTSDGNGGFSYSFDKLINLKLSTTNMVLINEKKNEVRPITLSELKDYKTYGEGNYYVVAYMSYQSPNAVYVYER
ncbi:MAG: hypothetical protein IJ460_07940 [Clostridia bacterium]|nr:hypothetical protein [Clostridia bacterium]